MAPASLWALSPNTAQGVLSWGAAVGTDANGDKSKRSLYYKVYTKGTNNSIKGRSVCTADVNGNSPTKWVICTFIVHLKQLGGITVYENKWPKPTCVLLRCRQCWLLSFNAGSVKSDLLIQWILRGWMVQSSAHTAEWLMHSIKI